MQPVLKITTLISALFLSGMIYAAEPHSLTKIGLSGYHSQPRGALLGADSALPLAKNKGAIMMNRATPTNQWYSSVVFSPKHSDVIHAHPVTYRTSAEGFELGLATKRAVVTEGNQDQIYHAIKAGNTASLSPKKGRRVEIRYPHQAAITVGSTGFNIEETRLANATDWSVDIQVANQSKALNATILHGSPFSYYELSDGDATFKFSTEAIRATKTTDPKVMAFSVAGQPYAIFAPTGAKWEWLSPTQLVLKLPRPANYFSIAALPDNHDETLKEFLEHAYAFVRNTHVAWKYDENNSIVRTTYTVTTEVKEGHNKTALIGLYPHQWRNTKTDQPLKYAYSTVRGNIKILAANEFSTTLPYQGILPYWGSIENIKDKEWLNSVMEGDHAKAASIFGRQHGKGTYWTGKALAALGHLMHIAAQQGNIKARDAMLKIMKQRMETWFSGTDGTAYFVYDKQLGTLAGYPDEFGSVKEMNDHHFHYGYWIQAAAQIALYDPDWASQEKWGGIVEMMIKDIATTERGRADYPFIRNFDVYEGHGWASGLALTPDGNNEESSSESMNAWASIILWGALTHNTPLRDLGIYLYTTQAESINNYWLDVHNQVLAPEFGNIVASMVFGGKYAYNTWWTEEPRQTHGINMLPITPASIYLGRYPDYIKKNISAIDEAKQQYVSHSGNDETPDDIWQDILNSYLALADPELALKSWNPKGSIETGETRTHTLHWLLSLKEMGIPDFSVTANTPFYSVFKNSNGTKKYLAFNPTQTDIDVKFSDGKNLKVPALRLVREQ